MASATTGTRTGSDSSGKWDYPNDATQELRKQATDIGREVGALARTASRAAGEQVENVKHAVTESAQSFERTVTEYVKDRPIQSLLIAAGAGVLAGLFFLRR